MMKASEANTKRCAKRAVPSGDNEDSTRSKKIAKGASKNIDDEFEMELGSPISSLRVADLRAELKSRGLSATGLKADLVGRLRKHLTSNRQKDSEEVSSDDEEDQTDPVDIPSPPPLSRFDAHSNANEDVVRDQPAEEDMKSGEININPHSLSKIELQQKVTELEEKLQRAIREGAEANSAKEAAEYLLDSKPMNLERENELQKSLADISTKLEEATRKWEEEKEELKQRNAKLQRENAELKNDSKMIENVEKETQGDSIPDLQKKLAAAKKREERAYNNNGELNRENAKLKNQVANLERMNESRVNGEQQLQERVNILNRHLSDMRAKYNEELARNGSGSLKTVKDEGESEQKRDQLNEVKSTNDELVRENSALKEELDALRRKMEDMTTEKEGIVLKNKRLENQLDESRRKKEIENEEIAMPKKLNESRKKAEKSKSGEGLSEVKSEIGSGNGLDVFEPSHTKTNIFHFCTPDTPNAVSLDSAINQIRPKVELLEKSGCKMIFFSILCKTCNVKVPKPQILNHFLTSKHIEKVRAANGAVSLKSLTYWLDWLDKVVPAAATPLAADAAAPSTVQQSVASANDVIVEEESGRQKHP